MRQQYIAHFIRDDKTGIIKIHSVKEHCLAVAKYARNYAMAVKCPAIGELAGLLHDMGKYREEFQDYMDDEMQEDRQGQRAKNGGDHGYAGASFIYYKYHRGEKEQRIVAEILMMIIAYHHGGLEDYITQEAKAPLLERVKKGVTENSQLESELEQVTQIFFSEVCKENRLDTLFKQAVQEYRNFTILSSTTKTDEFMLIKCIYSCLIDADRLDTAEFMDQRKWNEKIADWPMYEQRLQIKLQSFQNRSNEDSLADAVYRVRQRISKECIEFAERKTGIYTLTVPTGGGKTFSSLAYALKHARIHRNKRIIYVLPYTTIIEQNAEEVREVLQCQHDLLEHHLNVLSENKEEGYELMTARWDTPFIFTTTVQFLNTLFNGGTKDVRRLHNLSDAIIIFDEIQAMPVKCLAMFNEAINFLNEKCNSTIVLCSATQITLEEMQYPIHLPENHEMICDISNVYRQLKRVNIIDMTEHNNKKGFSYEEAVDFAFEKIQKVNSLLMVLNTKKTAGTIYEKLKNRIQNMGNDIEIIYLSTNLCSEHRSEQLEKLRNILNESGRTNKKVICISTQVIEAGVDISFSCVIRHQAGLDSIIQAAGRCNRHGESEMGNVYIIKLQEEHLGSLKQIATGEEMTSIILRGFRKDEGRKKLGGDLLSPEAMKMYFTKYVNCDYVKKNALFPVKVTGITGQVRNKSLFEVMSQRFASNSKKVINSKKDMSDSEDKVISNLILEERFKEVGHDFHVFDENTSTILVPYGKGKIIIGQFLSAKGIYEKVELLQEMQKYCINVYEQTIRGLLAEEAIITDYYEGFGIYMLKDRYYDEVTGLTMDGNLELIEY